MAKIPKIPYEISNQLHASLCEFGCARWKAFLRYAEALARGCGSLSEEYRAERAEGIGEKAVAELLNEGVIKKADYADEKIVLPVGKEAPSFMSLNAFEAFAAITIELAEKNRRPDLCYPGKTDNYPFHYVFAAEKTLYRVIVYGQDAISRIGFFNSVYNEARDKHFETLLVVPEAYTWEEFEDVFVRGRTRIAFVQEVNPKRKTYKCTLTDIIIEK